ncbi:MAG TPA: hypothetical protein PLH92_06100 [Mycobacterium sp.]|uniref:hypothetical protein n=1 Tax=Mycolicibacterium sp. TaxID=2320850 RepID=UPI0025EA2CC0|nr:hypothetical protein [Mycolicibacterium sp.]HPX37826.1 hypothetical protein [Mycobacterium sp.]HQC76274.1 hypothetical protein [Mycobacterium sp.]
MAVPLRRRLGLLILALIGAGGCLTLGWWQWSRWESNSGSFQNLGYALQWPLFAGFCIFAYRKFIRLEQSGPQPPRNDGDVTEIPAGLLPERPAPAGSSTDPVLTEYNAYLAELAEKDKRTSP